MNSQTKYADGWYEVRSTDDKFHNVFRIVDGRVEHTATTLEFYEKKNYAITPIHLVGQQQTLYAVVVSPPYDDKEDLGYIAGTYTSEEDARSTARDLNNKLGRGHATVVYTHLSDKYTSPEPVYYDYRVTARIQGFVNQWSAQRAAGAVTYNMLHPAGEGRYRIEVRARNEKEAIAEAKAVFKLHIGD